MPGPPDQSLCGVPYVCPVEGSKRTCKIPATVHQQVPSSSQTRSGSMPGTSGAQTGSDHGPAGSVAVTIRLPPPLLQLVTISQKRPSWCRRVGA
ncbi:hypothetical protein QFZ49_006581 [Streptomyces turgidiscabies]|uniref:Uncharacterized protein n=1 Tax=Streptomyces turgidiscabies TaxID=85558 RepID=A0ABU0RXA9_9ACTN|nr:hypothetical protein [Streptomyces turgidiscabies]